MTAHPSTYEPSGAGTIAVWPSRHWCAAKQPRPPGRPAPRGTPVCDIRPCKLVSASLALRMCGLLTPFDSQRGEPPKPASCSSLPHSFKAARAAGPSGLPRGADARVPALRAPHKPASPSLRSNLKAGPVGILGMGVGTDPSEAVKLAWQPIVYCGSYGDTGLSYTDLVPAAPGARLATQAHGPTAAGITLRPLGRSGGSSGGGHSHEQPWCQQAGPMARTGITSIRFMKGSVYGAHSSGSDRDFFSSVSACSGDSDWWSSGRCRP
ncbi:hypothetical protein TSOC_012241 [Tetrabaena socialis]|uniref:Uncharacterized protein n=1 Tax=Tetrabaena socialis TaxID=47790 RepID=A0A2J7ZNL3_9CHLO|nr:hypothetical protein TSOC_012241 [Tetrabaena socialis]|eukprot:PNH01838.1 hypothetical protein TSOC_012241 [Tetrabaena socialis]